MKNHPENDNFRYLDLGIGNDEGTVLVVSLNRPRKHNALNAAFWKEIGVLFRMVGDSPSFRCRCILLLGNGPSFCAGIDISDPSFLSPFSESDDGGDPARAGLRFEPKLKQMQQAFTEIELCPVPVVAAMHGFVVGGGIDLVTATQVRLCTKDTQFAVKEVQLGLAADVGTLQRFPKLSSNQSLVHELCYTGRKFSAQEALQLGLVSRVVASRDDLVRESLQLCCQIARYSPIAVHGTKRALLYSRDHSVQEGLEQIAAFNIMALQSGDTQKAFMAAAAKEEASFDDIPVRSKL